MKNIFVSLLSIIILAIVIIVSYWLGHTLFSEEYRGIAAQTLLGFSVLFLILIVFIFIYMIVKVITYE